MFRYITSILFTIGFLKKIRTNLKISILERVVLHAPYYTIVTNISTIRLQFMVHINKNLVKYN